MYYYFKYAGKVVISGSSGGLLIISSSTTGMTLRAMSDHKLYSIRTIDVASNDGLWLACSSNQRVSLWRSDWSKDSSEMVDWIAPASDVADEIKTTIQVCRYIYQLFIFFIYLRHIPYYHHDVDK